MQPEAPIRGLEALGGTTRAERRLANAVASLLPRIFMEGERVIAATEAVQAVSWRSRRVFGLTWPFVHRVALVFTDRRLLEIVLRPAGRRPTGCVWEYAWSTSPYPRADRQTLTLGDNRRWLLRRPLPPRVRDEVVKLSKTGTQPLRRAGKARAWRLCPRCGVTAVNPGARCSRCGALNRSSRLAASLAVAFPGAGMAYLGRPGYALMRFVMETAAVVAATILLLRADGAVPALGVAAIAAAVLLLLKAESVFMTRVLSRRTGTIGSKATQRWPKLLPLGALISIAALALPLLYAGATSTTISADLESASPHHGWSVEHGGEQQETETGRATRRAEWRHRDGWLVQATAWSFEPFERPGQVRERWSRQQQQEMAGKVEELSLGTHKALRATVADDESVVLRYLLLDEPGRDAHVLTARVDPSQVEEVDDKLQRLIRTLFWSCSSGAEDLFRSGPDRPES